MANREEGLSVLIIIGCISFQHSFRHLGSLRLCFYDDNDRVCKEIGLAGYILLYILDPYHMCVVFQG